MRKVPVYRAGYAGWRVGVVFPPAEGYDTEVRLFNRKGPHVSGGKAKKECRFCAIRLLRGDGTVLFEGPLENLRFTEKLIVAKSVYFFNDREPCFIHRSAVAARLFGELDLLFGERETISAAEVEKNCPGYLDEYPGADIIEPIGKE
jgi:hypothetical protein